VKKELPLDEDGQLLGQLAIDEAIEEPDPEDTTDRQDS
jgi:Mg/Co/Ni transporter MgtE